LKIRAPHLWARSHPIKTHWEIQWVGTIFLQE
jgi:hypothetical protein